MDSATVPGASAFYSSRTFFSPASHRPRFAPFLFRGMSTPVVSVSSSKTDKVTPVYKTTPVDRSLRTPHSGYHFDRSKRVFFEGWYFKVTIPECGQSFCFMYAVENPAFPNGMSTMDKVLHGSRYTGIGAMILGADDKFLCQFTEHSKNFWGSRHELMLGNTFLPNKGSSPPTREVTPKEFNDRVLEGFQVSPFWHQGSVRDDGSSKDVETVESAKWEYSTTPVYGWGDVNSKQKSTAGWLAAFPVFEPHWQVCMASGLSTGWIEWGGKRYEFENAPSYSEKNWGGGFPRKWFWVQCNVFDGVEGQVTVTAAGGLRKLPGLADTYETPALIGLHHEGRFYEFTPWTGNVSWEIAPWGYWHMFADNDKYIVDVEATTKAPGTPLKAPTIEEGLITACRDNCSGNLKLQMWEKNQDGSKGKLILDATSNMAAVEIGGGPWFTTWKGKAYSPEFVNKTLRLPLDVESFFPIPFFKPPGL